jgi:NAD(P)-dependent dehydrogenase (short-subunit alcohol dehydrogenase family)
MTKKILVTGSTRGIGLGIAEKFHSEGWNVCINGRNQNLVTQITDGLNKKRRESSIGIRADLSNLPEINLMSEVIKTHWSALDCIVFNIGSGHGTKGISSTMEENLSSLKTNFLDVINSFNNLHMLLLQSKPSSVIFIGSIAQDTNVNAPISYAYSKKALNNFARYQAIALSKAKISVNVINPGHILTEEGVWARKKQNSLEEFNEFIAKNIPAQRIGTTSEVAELVFSITDDLLGNFLSGVSINLDGGTSINA